MFRFLRIVILLTILVVVAGNQWLTSNRLSSWEKPVWITIFPILLDSDPDTRRYVERLTANSFQDINVFLKREAARYGRQFENPVVIQLARPLTALPPALPLESSGLNVALWSLKMRWWSWRNGTQDGLIGDDVRMYVLYQKKGSEGLMERSVGIKNGSYGLVNAAASRQMAARNRIVIAHELLHVLGAGDKYDSATGQPLAPAGLADPAQVPLYPQDRAEIMGARIAVSADNWRYPASLKHCVIGTQSATEIGWLNEN